MPNTGRRRRDHMLLDTHRVLACPKEVIQEDLMNTRHYRHTNLSRRRFHEVRTNSSNPWIRCAEALLLIATLTLLPKAAFQASQWETILPTIHRK